LLFNSYEFVLLFLPIAFVLFWYGGKSLRWRLGFLTFASYLFYSYWQFRDDTGSFDPHRLWLALHFDTWPHIKASLWTWRFTIVMFASSSVDYFAAAALAKIPRREDVDRSLNLSGGALSDTPTVALPRPTLRAALLALSLCANLGLLGFFKYAGFFSQIASDIAHLLGGGGFEPFAVILPVGISFYTFESMSYVIDVYRGIATPAKSYLDYACFISFFPHLVAGPIIRYSDILHQFRDVSWRRPRPDWSHVSIGVMLFTMGMAKKLLIADSLAVLITPLWDRLGMHQQLGSVGAWAAVLGYTFRIYFDFSGYSDMATGLGHLFAVRLPQNFNSPYIAANPSDFWRRWHMTLSLWLRDYLYIPLGGSRGGTNKTLRNLLITMLLGGLWHGAAWLFVIWGAWHGLMLAVYHVCKDRGWLLPTDTSTQRWFNRQLTFLFVVIGWTFFRAADVHTGTYGWASIVPAFQMLTQMFIPHGGPRIADLRLLAMWIAFSWLWCNFVPNSFDVAYGLKLRRWHAAVAGAAMAVCMLYLGTHMDFLYFRF
jgi:D-alanyl-lipoteichoic acid acyltransferase DltB (MBOAT superfamily)